MSVSSAYGRLVWQEGPMVLGWHRWREFEEKYGYGIVERFVRALMDVGYLECRPVGSVVRFAFWILGAAGLAVAEAPRRTSSGSVRSGVT